MTDRSGRYERLTSTWRFVTSSGTPGNPARSLPTRRAAFMQIPRRSRSFITKENTTNAMAAIFARHRRKAGRCFGKPVLRARHADFAAKHAEAIFAVHPNIDRMKQYAADLGERLENKFSRAPGSVKLIYGLADRRRGDAFGGAREIREDQGLHPAGGRLGLDVRAFRARLLYLSPGRHRSEY